MTRDPQLNPKQWHHGYVGVALIIISGILAALALVLVLSADDAEAANKWARIGYISAVLSVIGATLWFDDARQHLIQHTRPGYRSPVNRLWGWILRKVGK